MSFFLVTIVILVSQVNAFCPLCPIIATAAVSGGMSTGNALIASAATGLVSVPFALAFIDGFRTRNVTFEFPKENQTIVGGRSYDLYMHTFGLSSRFHLRTADLYLLNSTFDRVAQVGSEREFKVITNVSFAHHVLPRAGFGYLNWTAPKDLPTGRYYLKYVSGWTLWRHEGKFSAISAPFVLAQEDACWNAHACVPNRMIAPSPRPDSFDTETAPLELQFMYPHYKNVPTAAKDFVDGVIDVPEGAARALATFVTDPKQVLEAIKHPVRAAVGIKDSFEEQFERNPMRATGQAVGVGVGLIGTVAGVRRLRAKPVSCPGGVCSLRPPVTVLQVKGVSCKGCTDAIRQSLQQNGIRGVSFTPVTDGSTQMIVHDASVSVDKLQEMMDDLGFDSVLVALD